MCKNPRRSGSVSRVYSEWCKKSKTSSEWQLYGRKRLVHESSQQKMAQTGSSWQKGYGNSDNHFVQLWWAETSTHWTLRRMGYSEFRVLQSPDLNPVEQLWNAVEQESHSMNAQLRNDHVILEQKSQRNVWWNPGPWRIEAALRAKGGLPSIVTVFLIKCSASVYLHLNAYVNAFKCTLSYFIFPPLFT